MLVIMLLSFSYLSHSFRRKNKAKKKKGKRHTLQHTLPVFIISVKVGTNLLRRRSEHNPNCGEWSCFGGFRHKYAHYVRLSIHIYACGAEWRKLSQIPSALASLRFFPLVVCVISRSHKAIAKLSLLQLDSSVLLYHEESTNGAWHHCFAFDIAVFVGLNWK